MTHEAGAAATLGRPGPKTVEIRNRAGVAIELLGNGSVFAIRHGGVLVNQVLGSPVEGGIANVYLRRRSRDGIAWFPVIGPGSPSRFSVGADRAAWEGSADGLDYTCTLRLAARRPTWFWTLELRNGRTRRVSVDAVLAQDLGIASEAAIRSSELYTSQYIDHTILEDDDLGFLICSRQNLPQGEAFPWLMHGCLDRAVGYLTDGFQFYGLSYRATNRPVALDRRRLPNRNYQYEVALPTLQSRAVAMRPGERADLTFFAAYEPDHPAATSDADAERAHAARASFRGLSRRSVKMAVEPPADTAQPPADGLFDDPILFDSRDLETAELERRFGSAWRHVERRDGRLLSFFHGPDRHVVLRAKELVAERPTGLVLRSGRNVLPSDDSLSTTAWMGGVFASQATVGNTSFNKLLSVCRNPLNVLKASGQRIFVRSGSGWRLLGLPSAFEMARDGARWIYDDGGICLAISTTVSPHDPICRLQLEVERGGPLELLVSHDVVLGEHEYDEPGDVRIDVAAGRVELRPGPGSLLAERYPDAAFFIAAPDVERIDAIGGAELLFADGVPRGDSHVVFRTKPVSALALAFGGSVLDPARAADPARRPADADDEAEWARFWSGLGRSASLGGAHGRRAVDLTRLDDLVRWYLHDALIHLSAPHGLEQAGGAAWGLRDVCQGPVELLVATGNLGPLRDLLLVVYEHQSRESADWPQWFMFDRYRGIRAPDSHADVIHWPIKALCDYIEASNDLSILDEPVAWADDRTGAATRERDTLFAHVEAQVARIEHDCIPGTELPIFAGGDWEDTLQPADPAMSRRLVSSWTVELAWQVLDRLRDVCDRAGRDAMADRLRDRCARLRTDFNRHLVPDGVVAGLAHFGPDEIEYFLHPRDRRTGVSYRLLPMTRGMISGIFTAEQVERHLALIERHLTFPDGVRLMDRPMEYRGGTMRWFRRAESAANFGREVGLQYVHAHIRYVEAMARIGRPDEAFRGLLTVCPIGLELDIPSALPRQANAYFSSSDAAFMDRREASREFGRLRTGRVGVKGGWRVYSSGPGIYLNQLVSNVLGLRRSFGDVVIDPVLPASADGLTFDLEHEGRQVRYRYRISGVGFSPRELSVNGRSLPTDRRTSNPYRAGGLLVPEAEFARALDREQNLVEIVV